VKKLPEYSWIQKEVRARGARSLKRDRFSEEAKLRAGRANLPLEIDESKRSFDHSQLCDSGNLPNTG